MKPNFPDRRRAAFGTAGLLAAFALAVVLRMPDIVLTGRFFAEEAQIFFANAWMLPPSEALLWSYGGYLNLVATAAPLAARWLLPLAWAPYATIATGLLFQLAPALLLLTARDVWLRPWPVRAAALLLILFVPDVDEIWLQSLHAQFQLALCVAIILALEPARGGVGVLRRAILILAPLCGPVAGAMLPLFCARALLERSRPRAVEALVLGAGTAIQLLFFLHPQPGRGQVLSPVVLLCVIAIRHIDLPFLGSALALRAARDLQATGLAGGLPWREILLPFGFFVPLTMAALRDGKCGRAGPAFWLLAAGGLVALATYAGTLGPTILQIEPHAGERYGFVPQAAFGLSILALAAGRRPWSARLSRIAVAWLLVAGGSQYARPWSYVSQGPAWRDEIAAWRRDPAHVVAIWPEGWTTVAQGRGAPPVPDPLAARRAHWMDAPEVAAAP